MTNAQDCQDCQDAAGKFARSSVVSHGESFIGGEDSRFENERRGEPKAPNSINTHNNNIKMEFEIV